MWLDFDNFDVLKFMFMAVVLRGVMLDCRAMEEITLLIF